MKKLLGWIISLFLLLMICACGGQDPQMEVCYVEPAQLSEAERQIINLLGESSVGSLFDFVIDGTLSNVSIQVYELENGAWKLWPDGSDSVISGSFKAAKKEESGRNRILIDLDGKAGQLKIALQEGGSSSKYESQLEVVEDRSGMSAATAYLSQRVPIQPNVEIPLLIQVVTSKNEVRSHDPATGFLQPEDFAGYEAVYAVTLLFQS